MNVRLASLVLVAVLAGCNGTDNADDDGTGLKRRDVAWVDVSGRKSQHIELDDFDVDWDDIDIRDDGSRDTYEVAKFVKERRDAVQRCLTANPPDQVQAAELLETILKHVPDSSRDRGNLAQVTFADASYWFQTADRVGWEVQRLRVEKSIRDDVTGDVIVLDDERVEEIIKGYVPYLEKANKRCQESSRSSLKQWDLYRKLRPDDRAVADYIWKLYFYSQDYRSALRWLDLVLREMELNETPKEEPLRQDYEEIRRAMVEYIAKLKIDGQTGSGRVLPFGKSARNRLNGDFTPGD